MFVPAFADYISDARMPRNRSKECHDGSDSDSASDFSSNHKKKATRPAIAAPMLMKPVAASPLNGVGVELVGDVMVELLDEPLVRVKLAQVRRVVLLVWMLMERLPRKLPSPACVET